MSTPTSVPSSAPLSPPPPPNPTDAPSITGANYFFGFIVTFAVLLLVFVGCGIGSWRRFRLIGTAWDERLQDMEGSPFSTRKRGRRRMVRPVFSETWTHPSPSDERKWEGIQPISAAFVWSRSKLLTCARKPNTPAAAAQVQGQREEGFVYGVAAGLRSYVLPRHGRRDHPPRPSPATRPPPEAIQVAVMIAMPAPSSQSSGLLTANPSYVGHSRVGEYQIGLVRIPWPSGEGP